MNEYVEKIYNIVTKLSKLLQEYYRMEDELKKTSSTTNNWVLSNDIVHCNIYLESDIATAILFDYSKKLRIEQAKIIEELRATLGMV